MPRANPNLLAILGVILVLVGAGAYILLPVGSDRGAILVVVIPIAGTLLSSGVVGNKLNEQTSDIKRQTDTIIKQTNGALSRSHDEIARAAVRAVKAEDGPTIPSPRRTRKAAEPKTDKESDNG